MNTKFERFKDADDVTSSLQEETGIDDGFDLSGYSDASYDSVEVARVGDKIIVGMLHYDSDPQDFFDNDEGSGQLIQFSSPSQRDQKVAEMSKTKKLFYLVNKYAHGNVHYSVTGTRTYSDERFDVAHGSAMFIPSSYIQGEFRKMKKAEGEGTAYEHFIKNSNSLLDSYSDWCNGEVYGYTVVTFDKKGEEIDCDQCWGFIGSDNAQEEKRSIMKNVIIRDELDKLLAEVPIENVSIKEMELPFKVVKKGLEEIKVAHVYDTYVVGAKYAGEDNVVVYNWSEGQEKPTKAKFEEWQKRHGTTPEKFLSARMDSDIKEVIRQKLKNQNQSENKLSI